MRRGAVIPAFLAVVLAGACGDDGGSVDDDDSGSSSGTSVGTTSAGTTSSTSSTTAGSTTEAGDTEAPEFLDVRVSIDEGSVVDLNGADVRRVLPDPASAEFTIRARDDVTEDENIVIEIVDMDTGEPVGGAEATFVNGLWRVTATVESAHTYRPRAADEAANSADSEFALVTPSLGEAVVGTWDAFEYDTDMVSEVLTLTMMDDGTWTESAQFGTLMRAGTWSVDGDTLSLVETSNSDGDTNPDTEDGARVGAFYVDEDYLDIRPYLADDDQVDDVEGSWTRTWVEQDPGGGGLQDARTVDEVLVLSNNGDFTRTRTTTPTAGPAEVFTEAGTWDIELNGEYIGNYGDFLVLTKDEEDGQPVDPAQETWSLHRARAGRLLVTPYVPADG